MAYMDSQAFSFDIHCNVGYNVAVMSNISIYIKNKYYTFVPGEFIPVYMDGELHNKRSFHRYKLARAKWRLLHLRIVFHELTHKHGSWDHLFTDL